AAEAVFGVPWHGQTLETLASQSKAEFVRTQYHLSVAVPEATGFRLRAADALREYGWKKLSELSDFHSVALVEHSGEPYDTLIYRAKQLGLNIKKLQIDSKWT